MHVPDLPLDADEVPPFDDVLAPEAIRFLAERGVRRGLTVAFQSLLAATIETVAEATVAVRAASDVAISLAQKTHVAAVADGLDAVVAALRGGLSEQGLALVTHRRGPVEALRDLVRPASGWRPRLGSFGEARAEPAPPSWAVAMTTAADTLAEAAAYTATLAAAQPDRSSARILGEGVAVRLARDRDVLLGEAARSGE